MPRRALELAAVKPPPFDREAVELALPDQVRWHLAEILRGWRIARTDRWPDHPLAADILTMLAVVAQRDRELSSGVKTETAALAIACGRLGLKVETVRSRLATNHRAYLNASASVLGVETTPKSKVVGKPTQTRGKRDYVRSTTRTRGRKS